MAADYSHVFSLLSGLRPCGSGKWTARCPSHDDRHQSLSIKIGDNGAILFRCHAPHGCSVESIARSMGMELDDFFPDNKRTRNMSDRKFVCAYDYCSEKGELLFQSCRFEPKGFSQRKKNPSYDPKKTRDASNPEFIYNLDGVRRVLYKLPQLLKSLKERPDRWVFVLEGEKAVDVAVKNGITATCNPMGALKWDESYSTALAGCNVVVVPDEDAVDIKTGFSPGLRHAEMVCDSLKGQGILAKTVRVLRLGTKPKDGFDDWWDSLTVPEAERKNLLAHLATAASEWMPGTKLTPFDFSKPKESEQVDLPLPTPAEISEARAIAGDLAICLFKVGGFYIATGRDAVILSAATGLPESLWPAERLSEAVHKLTNANLRVGVFDRSNPYPTIHEPATHPKGWDGEVTPAMEAIANVVPELSSYLPEKEFSRIAALLLREIGEVASIFHLSQKLDKPRLRKTLSAIGGWAMIAIDHIDKEKSA
jgi:hypothetical protein